jgi:hypothetical protein
MNDLCPSDAWVPRVTLVVSNVSFLIPCVYVTIILAKSLMKRYRTSKLSHEFALLNLEDGSDRRAQFFPEHQPGTYCHDICLFLPDIATMLTLFFCSVFYHVCFDSYMCTRRCILNYQELADADYIMAFQTLSLVVIWNVERKQWVWKLFCYIAIFLYIGLGYSYIISPRTFYIGLALCLVMCILLRVIVSRKEFVQEIRGCKWYFLLLAILFGFMGLYFQLSIGPLVGGQEPESYWWRHSLWHIFLGLALMFRFCSSSSSGSSGS